MIGSMQGRTILITGASGGLGEEFARRLADDNTLILIARREDRLKKIQKSLARKARRVHILSLDLSQPGSAEKIFKQVRKLGLQVDFLINNAGYGYYGQFQKQDSREIEEQIRLNCASLASLSGLFGQSMAQRKSGLILNVASIQGFLVLPFYSVYAATKAFVVNFSLALRAELKSQGVVVSCLCPGYTSTEFAQVAHARDKRARSVLGEMKTEDVVRYALERAGASILIPGFRNRLMVFSSRFSPRILSVWIARWLLKPS